MGVRIPLPLLQVLQLLSYRIEAFLFLLSLGRIPAVIVYPVISVGTIILVSLAGYLFFGESLSRRKLLAMGIILLALVLLNV